jgi:cell filamentation protein
VTFADPYVYPGTETLRNNLGIRDPVRLAVAEASITAVSLTRLGQHHLDGSYNLDHLKAFHWAVFADLYPWAGEIRTVRIAKSALFALPEHIEPYLTGQLSRLAGENHLRNLERGLFIERLTDYLAEVNAVHPFREGNGRTQRSFFGQLARDAGYEIRWDRLDPARNIEASVASLNGDNSKLHSLLRDLVESE